MLKVPGCRVQLSGRALVCHEKVPGFHHTKLKMNRKLGSPFKNHFKNRKRLSYLGYTGNWCSIQTICVSYWKPGLNFRKHEVEFSHPMSIPFLVSCFLSCTSQFLFRKQECGFRNYYVHSTADMVLRPSPRYQIFSEAFWPLKYWPNKDKWIVRVNWMAAVSTLW